MDFHTSLLMICTSFVICCCFPQVAEAAPRPTDPFEIQALRTIYQKLGKRDWNFSADPCSGEGGGRSSDSQNYVNCNCTRNDGKYCRVTHIILKSQNLEGVLPPELTSLKYLEEIDLRSNYITGSIPEQLGSLPYLLNLNLSANHLSGQIPKKLGNLTRLVSLLIASNKFSGSLPPELGKLATLKELDVSTNSFNGRIPSSFANLIELQEFRASSNNFIGNIPSYIGSWKNLKKLMIQGTSLEGPIPFISSSSLSDLRISDIALQGGSSLQFLQNLINLKILVLRNNLICGEIPKYLQNLRKLEIL